MIVNGASDMEVIGEASDGHEAIELAIELKPDIVLMDISMPKLNGITAAATLKRRLPSVSIITLTRHTDDAYLRELFQAGVSGYVLKQSSATELVNAIRTVAAGDTFLDPAMTGMVFGGFGDRRTQGQDGVIKLTTREEAVLHDIARGYSSREIAEKLDISAKTVDAFKATAMKKLKITTRHEIIRYAILRDWMTDD